jgi:branched-chain amino acid transport system ATP-binding protein
VTAPLFEARGLAVRFGGVEALRGLSLAVTPLELLAVVGPNGAGKSTLLNVCTGYVRPDRGSVFFRGRDLTGLPPRAVARAGIGRSFQHPQVFGPYTVMDNLRFAASAAAGFWCMRDLRGGGFDPEAAALAQLFGLGDAVAQTAGTTSAGTRKLLDIAMALALRPALLFMDEPTSSVSAHDKFGVMDRLVKALRDRGATGVFVEHDMEVVERYADRVAVVAEGSLLAAGPPGAILRDPALAGAVAAVR